MSSLYIIIPAYNEQETIESVIDEWYPVVEKYGDAKSKLIVIDDGSKDKTYDIVLECAVSRPQLQVIKKENSGHGATILYGYKYALKEGAEYIFQTDSDGQTSAAEFENFWNQRFDYDMLIGNRSKRQDGISRVIVTKTLKFVIRVCFGVNVKDANTPYRLMKSEVLEKYIGLIPKDYFLTNVLVSVIYAVNERRVLYIPISFRPRQGGVNSINIRRIIKIGKNSLKDFWMLRGAIKL